METALNIIADVLSSLLFMAILFVLKKGYDFLERKISAEDMAELDKFIEELTAAADQMYKKVDPDGSIRFEFVKEALRKAGYQITDAIVVKIESCVFHLPHTSKGGESQ